LFRFPRSPRSYVCCCIAAKAAKKSSILAPWNGLPERRGRVRVKPHGPVVGILRTLERRLMRHASLERGLNARRGAAMAPADHLVVGVQRGLDTLDRDKRDAVQQCCGLRV
jgi:hypothetical protein